MPIEIRELVIKATVTPAAPPPGLGAAALAQLRQEVIAACQERLHAQLARDQQR